MLQNQSKYFFVLQRGIETITHIFRNLLLYTKNIELTIYHCKRAYIYYVEFIGQIGDDKNTYLQLNSKDATLFVYKKTKSRKVKANHIPNGWVKLKRVNGKIQKTYGKPIVRRQRNQHLTVATQKMFNGMWQTMEDSWSDGFWDCRQGQLEKILSDNLYNSDDDSLSDEEYYSDDNKEEEEETNTHLGRTKRS